jgi:hypothetical protein
MKTTKQYIETILQNIQEDLAELKDIRLTTTESTDYKKKLDKKTKGLELIKHTLFQILDLD